MAQASAWNRPDCSMNPRSRESHVPGDNSRRGQSDPVQLQGLPRRKDRCDNQHQPEQPKQRCAGPLLSDLVRIMDHCRRTPGGIGPVNGRGADSDFRGYQRTDSSEKVESSVSGLLSRRCVAMRRVARNDRPDSICLSPSVGSGQARNFYQDRVESVEAPPLSARSGLQRGRGRRNRPGGDLTRDPLGTSRHGTLPAVPGRHRVRRGYEFDAQ